MYYETCSQISNLKNEINNLEKRLTELKIESTNIQNIIEKSMNDLNNKTIKHEEFYSSNSFKNLLSDIESKKNLIYEQMKEIINKTDINYIY